MGRPRKPEPKEKPILVTLEQRLAYGNLTVPEVCQLTGRSKTRFYEDLKLGLVTIQKVGRKSVVYGPIARRYASGDSLKA